MHSLAVFGYSLLLRCSASNIQDTEDTEEERKRGAREQEKERELESGLSWPSQTDRLDANTVYLYLFLFSSSPLLRALRVSVVFRCYSSNACSSAIPWSERARSPAAAFMVACAGDLAPGMATGAAGCEIT